MTILEDLSWRGLLYQTAGQDIETHVATPGRVVYCGFDPTGSSLTIGNYLPIALLRRWQLAGHRPIVLMGGGTGLIGDPSGKDEERQLQTEEQVRANVEAQKPIFERVLDFDPKAPNGAVMVNNLDWLGKLGFVEVLRDVGKHFSVNVMMQKDSVKTRLESRDHGISYTEFSYMILQAYDFLHLHREMGCTVQTAGSDQYGNIVMGMDLIRRVLGHDRDAFGVTCPLLMGPDGKKIGKTEKGAVWLTKEKTSPYQFYQYWINTSDANVIEFLKWFTFLPPGEIGAVAERHEAAPHERAAQKVLARAMTTLMHGEEELARVEAAAGALFGQGDVRELDADLLEDVFADVPHSTHEKAALGGDGVSLVELLTETSVVTSKRQAREFLGNGAIFVNGEKAPADGRVTERDLLHGTTILIRRGKKAWHATKWR
jgi:tyrosyl-tRNA synthetase